MIELKESIIEKLKCTECDAYLSCAPVMIKSNGDSVCGRCTISSDNDDISIVRNTAYEEVATIIAFPCRYHVEGCAQKLKWNNVTHHEENCDYRLHDCPAFPTGSCSWSGTNAKLLDHYITEHPNLLLEYPTKLIPDWKRDSEDNYLMTVLGFLFLVQIKLNAHAGKLWHCVRYLGNNAFISNFEYTLEISNYDCVMLKTRQVSPRDALVINRNNSIEVNIKSLIEFLGGCEHIAISININKKGNVCFRCKGNLKNVKIYSVDDNFLCFNCKPITAKEQI